jgi:hypothetical protein
MHDTTINMHQLDLKSIILNVTVVDQHYLHVKEGLQQENVQQKIKEYEIKEYGLFMYKKNYVPSSRELRNLVLKEMYNVSYTKHISY